MLFEMIHKMTLDMFSKELNTLMEQIMNAQDDKWRDQAEVSEDFGMGATIATFHSLGSFPCVRKRQDTVGAILEAVEA